MGLDRPPGQVQLGGDLGARMTERDQSQDLGLAGAQAVAADRLAQGLDAGRDVGAEVFLTHGGPLHRHGELVVGPVLEYESDRTGVECLLGKDGTRLHGQDHDLCLGNFGAQLADRLDTRTVGELEVQDENVRSVSVYVARDGGEIGRLSHDLEILVAVEHQTQAPADAGVIIGQHDADRMVRPG